MTNLLISKRDPYSFMSLLKAGTRPTGEARGTTTTSAHSLLNAVMISLLLIVAITQMAQATLGSDQRNLDNLSQSEMPVESPRSGESCAIEACKMV